MHKMTSAERRAFKAMLALVDSGCSKLLGRHETATVQYLDNHRMWVKTHLENISIKPSDRGYKALMRRCTKARNRLRASEAEMLTLIRSVM